MKSTFVRLQKPIPKKSNICSRESKPLGGCIKVDADSEGVECISRRLHATPSELMICGVPKPSG